MKKDKISIESVRESLRRRAFAGISFPLSTTVSHLYATIASLEPSETVQSTADDWATVSYVRTNSALGSGGMPEWVAEDVEQVLDGLIHERIISERALWFDKIGMQQDKEWPVLSTLHCLAAPVICVPPTRTLEYSRYQIPDRWDAATFDFFTSLEDMLRSCLTCGSKCPMEFDSRLLNVAAALRAWPTNEAIMGAASRGAFISFATLDRLQYTISWYQVLLQIALELSGYGPDLLAKSVELYGNALFQPCAHCGAIARQYMYEEETVVNCQLLDDTLVALVMQANRFALPTATEQEGMELWSLDGLYKSPGEGFHHRKNNPQRIREFSRKFISQASFEEIAANFCRGRPSLASCFREGDKWLCALILSNIQSYVDGISSTDETFSKASASQILKLLKLENPFGDLFYRDSTLEVDVNRCMRSPACSGQKGNICFFNELSGLLRPASVGEFLDDRGYCRSTVADVLSDCMASFRSRIQKNGIALLCYELKRCDAKDFGISSCGECFMDNPGHNIRWKQLVLFGWKAKLETETLRGARAREDEDDDEDIVYSFVTVNADISSHVQSRGIFCRSNAETCPTCNASYIRTDVDGCSDVLEIHIRRPLPLPATLGMIHNAMSRCHAD